MSVRYYNGQRIYFRPIELTDCAKFVEWFNDPDNWRTLARSNPINQLREKEFIEGLYKSNTDVAFGIVLSVDDSFIGCCGLHGISPQARSASFGILIGEMRYQGLGFGGETISLALRYGFEELNLNRIELDVFAGNERGLRAYRRAGFVQEGRRRQAFYRNGRYHDVIHMAVLREDWADAVSETENEARLSSMTT